jgi:group I intron endonuclease
MKHYVYKLIEISTNEFYYGVRSCKCNPIDDSYMGSMVTWKPNKDNLIKEIVSEFDSREDAINFESKLIEESIKHPLNKNYHTGAGLSFNGKAHSNETKQKVSNTMSGRNVGKNNPFYGRKHTAETIDKIVESQTGTTHSDETKRKMSESALSIDRSSYNYKRTKVQHIPTGKIYDSVYNASKDLGISRGKIHKDITSRTIDKNKLQFKLV